MRRRLLRDAALALVITPTIFLFPLILGAFREPAMVARYWDVYLPFLGLPYLLGVMLAFSAFRRRSSTPPSPEP